MDNDDMSNTFVAEVGQKSAIFGSRKQSSKDSVEMLEDADVVDNEDKEIIGTDSNDELIDDNAINNDSQSNNSKMDPECNKVYDSEENDQGLFPEVKIDPPEEVPNVLKEKEELNKNENDNTTHNNIDQKFVLPESNGMDGDVSDDSKKKNPFGKFLLIILCLAIGAGSSYYYFEIYNNNDIKPIVKKVDKKQNYLEELKPDSKYVKRLVEQYTDFDNSLDLFLPMLGNNSIKIKELDPNYLQILGAYNIRNYNSFTEEELQNSLDELYGVGVVTATNEDIVISKCKKYKYKEDSFSLSQTTDCNNVGTYFSHYKIVKAIKDNKKEEIYINVAVALSDGKKVYKEYDQEEEIAKDEVEDVEVNSLNINNDYTKFNQYKYTYKYDKDNDNYYLDSIDLEK